MRPLICAVGLLVTAVASLGGTDSISLDGDTYPVEWLHPESFDDGWHTRWAVEGDSMVFVMNGRLYTRALGKDAPRSATVW